MPFPYIFPFDFDVGLVGSPIGSMVYTGLIGTIRLVSRSLPTASIGKVTMIGTSSGQESIVGAITQKQDLSGTIE